MSHSLTQTSFSRRAECAAGEGGSRAITGLLSCAPHTHPPCSAKSIHTPAPLHPTQLQLCKLACKVFVDSAHLSGTTATDATAECVQPLLFLSLPHLVGEK